MVSKQRTFSRFQSLNNRKQKSCKNYWFNILTHSQLLSMCLFVYFFFFSNKRQKFVSMESFSLFIFIANHTTIFKRIKAMNTEKIIKKKKRKLINPEWWDQMIKNEKSTNNFLCAKWNHRNRVKKNWNKGVNCFKLYNCCWMRENLQFFIDLFTFSQTNQITKKNYFCKSFPLVWMWILSIFYFSIHRLIPFSHWLNQINLMNDFAIFIWTFCLVQFILIR